MKLTVTYISKFGDSHLVELEGCEMLVTDFSGELDGRREGEVFEMTVEPKTK